MKKRRGGWSWGPVEGVTLRALSLGAGIQSTTLALMAAHGEIGPMPDLALFADTGDESRHTYEHLEWLMSGNVLPFKVEIVSHSQGRSLSDNFLTRNIADGEEGAGHFVSAPFFTSGGGQAMRQCTRHFKVDPLKKAERALMGLAKGQAAEGRRAEIWIGISTDEVVRAGPAFDRWQVNRFPLLEQRMSRHDCENWLRRHDYPVPPKSACVFCPYRTDHEWRLLKETDPEGWAEAVRIDALVRESPRMREKAFLHRSLVPLAEVDLSTAAEKGQGEFDLVCDAGCGL
jgi:hypothetical protein